MKHFIMLYQLITVANANIMHGVEHWFSPELEDLAEHLTGMVRYYHDAGELTDYQADKLHTMARDLIEMYRHPNTDN